MLNKIRSLVKINESLPVGTVISYSEALGMWSKALDSSGLLAVVLTDTSLIEAESDGSFYVTAVFKGSCSVIASRDIPLSGGKIEVEDGKVFIDNSSSLNKFVIPYSGELVSSNQKIVVIF